MSLVTGEECLLSVAVQLVQMQHSQVLRWLHKRHDSPPHQLQARQVVWEAVWPLPAS